MLEIIIAFLLAGSGATFCYLHSPNQAILKKPLGGFGLCCGVLQLPLAWLVMSRIKAAPTALLMVLCSLMVVWSILPLISAALRIILRKRKKEI